MGLKNVLSGVHFTDTTLPKLHDDARLTAGSLLLVDPAHSANPWAAGVPANGALVPNLAWREAAALLGTASPTSASLGSSVQMAGGITATANAKGLVERTGKGGVHVIVSQASTLVATDGLGFVMDATIRAYLLANPTHLYYASAWYRVTRPNSTPSTKALALWEYGRGNTGIGLAQLNDAGAWTGTNAAAFSLNVGDGNPQVAGTVRRAAVAITPGSNLAPPTPTQGGPTFGYPGAASSGSYNVAMIATKMNTASSFVAYSWHLQDLTAAGISATTADAADLAAYNAAFATSGRYGGTDTYTAPSTIA